jgi:hypothetical protein
MDASNQSVRRVFEEGFTARDVAQALPSFDAAAPVEHAQAVMQQHGWPIAGVWLDGIVAGFVEAESLPAATATCGECRRDFAAEQLVSDALPLAPLVVRLKTQSFCFVTVWGQPCGVVSRVDVQKPPGRMWLFGMVTLIESRFSRLIAESCAEVEWQACLSPGRIQKAETLQAERTRCHQQVALLDCLQFADKTQIVARSEKLRGFTRFESKRQLEDIGHKLEKLRNNLAHSQSIVDGDWETVVLLAENLASILDGPVND